MKAKELKELKKLVLKKKTSTKVLAEIFELENKKKGKVNPTITAICKHPNSAKDTIKKILLLEEPIYILTCILHNHTIPTKVAKKLSKSKNSDTLKAISLYLKISKDKKENKKIFKKIESLLQELSKPIVKKKQTKKVKQTRKNTLLKHENKITKTIMVQKISEKTSLSKENSNNALTGILDAITESLKKGDNVSLIGFGTFSSEHRDERGGFNPYSREKIRIPEHNIAKFKAGKSLKDALK